MGNGQDQAEAGEADRDEDGHRALPWSGDRGGASGLDLIRLGFSGSDRLKARQVKFNRTFGFFGEGGAVIDDVLVDQGRG